MAESSRLDQLEAAVRELTKKLKPQAIRNALATTSDPRGYADWTRTIDDTGALVTPPRRAFQFPGATITDDPTLGDRGATVVTISGGDSANYRFSDTYPSANADERIAFAAESGPAVDHLLIDTGTIAGVFRLAQILVAENTASPGTAGYWQALVNDGGPSASLNTGAVSGAADGSHNSTSDGTTATANITASNGAHDAQILTRSDGGSTATAAQMSATEDGADITTLLVNSGLVQITADPALYAADVFTSSEESIFAQIGGSAAAGTPLTTKRMIRGPFTNATGLLVNTATVTFTLSDVRVGTDYVVTGGIKGGTGCEFLCWAWADNGTYGVDITVSNNGGPSVSADFYCYVISSA